jgi:CRISPR-associated endoribonuclease Cas6
LHQVQETDPDLSQILHDEQSEKAFTISGLEGDLAASGKEFQLLGDRIYRWYVTALSQRVVQWLSQWLQNLPEEIDLRNAPLLIRSWEIAFAPTTYQQLLIAAPPLSRNIKLSFVTPTSFRSKGHNFPLPVPENVFHSYLHRWNNFSGVIFEQAEFLTWIDENVIISRHKLESHKVAAGKKGMVTGFTGAVEFAIGRSATLRPDFVQLFYALGRLAPYCGTGHKTTFGLGQTRTQWLSEAIPEVSIQSVLAARIDELTEKFMAHRKRTGGSRAAEIAETWATILARRELGESLSDIAVDLEMPYETVKTYVKLARRALKVED